MTVQELIHQQMHHFIVKLAASTQLSHEKVIELSSTIGAYLIRTRHVQNKGISTEEIEIVLQTVVDFLNANFENQFQADDFLIIKHKTLDLLKNPGFDQEIQDYFKGFY